MTLESKLTEEQKARILNEVERERRKILACQLYEEGLKSNDPDIKRGISKVMPEFENVSELHNTITFREILDSDKETVMNTFYLPNKKTDEELKKVCEQAINEERYMRWSKKQDSTKAPISVEDVSMHTFVELCDFLLNYKNKLTRLMATFALPSLAYRHPAKFVQLYKRAIKNEDRLVKEYAARSIGSLAATTADEILKPIEDEGYDFLKSYLVSKHIHKESDESNDIRTEEDIMDELKKLFFNPNRDYAKIKIITEAGKARNLKEILKCSQINIPQCTILRKLGEGFDGVVYHAMHEYLGEVKIKIFTDPGPKIKKAMEEKGITLEDRVRRRILLFDKQVRNYHHLTKLYYPGKCKDPETGKDTFYLVMDYVDGGAIEIGEPGNYKIRSDIDDVVDIYNIFRMILSGLVELHEAGLVHRDLKLGNILCSKDHSTVRIDDMDIVAGIGEIQHGKRPTEGSDRYAAPEVIQNVKNSSPQSDMYSAAVCLVYMLTHDPYLIKPVNTLREEKEYDKRLKEILDKIPHFKMDEIRKIYIKKALAFRPEERYASAQQFKEDVFGREVLKMQTQHTKK